jgi:SET domain-containing protein
LEKFIGEHCKNLTRQGLPLKCGEMATALVKSPAINPKHTRFRLTIRESKIHRRGVYAEEQIPKGKKVIEYTGERISRRETKRRGQGSITYLFTLDSYWTIDGAVGGSGAEIINHSCDPNLATRIVRGHILYVSKRAIRPGEELTVDYRFSDKLERVRCRCGSPRCRGTINVKE